MLSGHISIKVRNVNVDFYVHINECLVTENIYCHIRQNDLFDQIWRKGVPLGSLMQKFSPPLYSLPKCKMRFFVKIAHLL